MADYNDRDLTCQDCEETFVFTADDQSYHAEKGFTNEPKRCAACRQTRRGQRGGGGGSSRYGERIQHPIVCSNCGQDSTVPSSLVEIVQFIVAIALIKNALKIYNLIHY